MGDGRAEPGDGVGHIVEGAASATIAVIAGCRIGVAEHHLGLRVVEIAHYIVQPVARGHSHSGGHIDHNGIFGGLDADGKSELLAAEVAGAVRCVGEVEVGMCYGQVFNNVAGGIGSPLVDHNHLEPGRIILGEDVGEKLFEPRALVLGVDNYRRGLELCGVLRQRSLVVGLRVDTFVVGGHGACHTAYAAHIEQYYPQQSQQGDAKKDVCDDRQNIIKRNFHIYRLLKHAAP